MSVVDSVKRLRKCVGMTQERATHAFMVSFDARERALEADHPAIVNLSEIVAMLKVVVRCLDDIEEDLEVNLKTED